MANFTLLGTITSDPYQAQSNVVGAGQCSSKGGNCGQCHREGGTVGAREDFGGIGKELATATLVKVVNDGGVLLGDGVEEGGGINRKILARRSN